MYLGVLFHQILCGILEQNGRRFAESGRQGGIYPLCPASHSLQKCKQLHIVTAASRVLKRLKLLKGNVRPRVFHQQVTGCFFSAFFKNRIVNEDIIFPFRFISYIPPGLNRPPQGN